MFIVYQNGSEITELHHAYVQGNKIMHFGQDQSCSELIASYDTHEEAQHRFIIMMLDLKDGYILHEFPRQRPTAPSEPSNP